MWAGGMRWSGSERAWCGIFLPLSDGRLLCRHELVWLHRSPEFAAEELLKFCKDNAISLSYVVAQSEIFPKTDELGETVSETFSRAGVPMRRGSSDRIACWSRLRSWLAPRVWQNGATYPALAIHPDCKVLIRTLPTLVKSETKPDDVASTPDEYPAMGLALFAMSRPSPWQKVEEKKPVSELSGAYLWNQLRNGEAGEQRYVGWNRHAKLR